MVCSVLVRAVQELVRQLFEAFVTEEQSAHHQQRRDRCRHKSADGQCGRHQDQLVAHRTQCHCPHYRQFAVGLDAGDLLGVQRQIIAQHTSGLLRSDLGHHGDIVGHGHALFGRHFGH